MQYDNRELIRTLIMERAGENVVDKLMDEYPSLPSLIFDTSEAELTAIKGIGKARAKQIKACCELAKRLYNSSEGKTCIKSPADVITLLMPEMRYLRKEEFRILLLDTKNHLQDVKTVSVGTLNSSLVHPREVFRLAIKHACSGVIAVHNHPSGDPEPSQEDRDTTVRLVNAGDILGIRLLDHIIIGDGRYSSLKEQGVI